MTAIGSNRTVLLDSHEAHKKARFLKFYRPIAITVPVTVWVVSLVIISKTTDPFNRSMVPAIVLTIIVAAIFGLIWLKLEDNLRSITSVTERKANAAITQFLEEKYSIRLLDLVMFHENHYASKNSSGFIFILSTSLRAIDLKTMRQIRVVLYPSPDRTDIQVSITQIAAANEPRTVCSLLSRIFNFAKKLSKGATS